MHACIYLESEEGGRERLRDRETVVDEEAQANTRQAHTRAHTHIHARTGAQAHARTHTHIHNARRERVGGREGWR